MSGGFGSAKYAEEDLVAEIASSFVGVTLNLPTDSPNHVNYMGHWLGKLKSDKRFVFKAAAQAQRAADWILDGRCGDSIRIHRLNSLYLCTWFAVDASTLGGFKSEPVLATRHISCCNRYVPLVPECPEPILTRA
jgi:hypothetical protein